MMKIRSKYLGKTFGNWKCVDVGIANIQGTKKKYAGHRGYYYVFQRRTSDDKADKMIRLNSTEAAMVYHGRILVEEILEKREANERNSFTREVMHHFGK